MDQATFQKKSSGKCTVSRWDQADWATEHRRRFAAQQNTAFDDTPTGIDLRSVGGSSDVTVADGVCRECCRLWIFAQNTPTVAASLQRSGVYGGKAEAGLPATLAFVSRNFQQAMVSQALANAKVVTGMIDVAGLAALYRKASSAKGIGKVLAGEPSLAMANVNIPGGAHAMAFDARGGRFIMFDPNYGMVALNAGVNATTFLADFFSYRKYTVNHLYVYTRC